LPAAAALETLINRLHCRVTATVAAGRRP